MPAPCDSTLRHGIRMYGYGSGAPDYCIQFDVPVSSLVGGSIVNVVVSASSEHPSAEDYSALYEVTRTVTTDDFQLTRVGFLLAVLELWTDEETGYRYFQIHRRTGSPSLFVSPNGGGDANFQVTDRSVTPVSD